MVESGYTLYNVHPIIITLYTIYIYIIYIYTLYIYTLYKYIYIIYININIYKYIYDNSPILPLTSLTKRTAESPKIWPGQIHPRNPT